MKTMKTSESYSIESVKHFLQSIACIAREAENDKTGLYDKTANNIRIILCYCDELENEILELKKPI